MTHVKESPIHGKGLFASQNIPINSHIGTFTGRKTDSDGEHVLWLYNEQKDSWHGIDGTGDLRYLNHSSNPNAEFTDTGELYALRSIKAGEEITIHYGEDWE